MKTSIPHLLTVLFLTTLITGCPGETVNITSATEGDTSTGTETGGSDTDTPETTGGTTSPDRTTEDTTGGSGGGTGGEDICELEVTWDGLWSEFVEVRGPYKLLNPDGEDDLAINTEWGVLILKGFDPNELNELYSGMPLTGQEYLDLLYALIAPNCEDYGIEPEAFVEYWSPEWYTYLQNHLDTSLVDCDEEAYLWFEKFLMSGFFVDLDPLCLPADTEMVESFIGICGRYKEGGYYVSDGFIEIRSGGEPLANAILEVSSIVTEPADTTSGFSILEFIGQLGSFGVNCQMNTGATVTGEVLFNGENWMGVPRDLQITNNPCP